MLIKVPFVSDCFLKKMSEMLLNGYYYTHNQYELVTEQFIFQRSCTWQDTRVIRNFVSDIFPLYWTFSLGYRSGLGTALLVGGSRDQSPVVLLGIVSEATDGTMCPGVDSSSKNEYQENSWE